MDCKTKQINAVSEVRGLRVRSAVSAAVRQVPTCGRGGGGVVAYQPAMGGVSTCNYNKQASVTRRRSLVSRLRSNTEDDSRLPADHRASQLRSTRRCHVETSSCHQSLPSDLAGVLPVWFEVPGSHH